MKWICKKTKNNVSHLHSGFSVSIVTLCSCSSREESGFTWVMMENNATNDEAEKDELGSVVGVCVKGM